MTKFQAWRATARMCLREKSYFGLANIVAQYLLRAAGLGALLMIWHSLFLQGADLTLLDHTFYKAVVTCNKYDKQEQHKHNPVFVLAQKHFELRQESVVHITLSVLQK